MPIIPGIFKKIAKVRIEGPINLQVEHEIIAVINKLALSPISAVALIINSYGGSISSTKSISRYLKNFCDSKELPIYCFAEDYCLNSANLLLSIGTKAYANKLTTMGDFGYSVNVLQLSQFQKQYKIGEIQISPMSHNKIKTGPFYAKYTDDKSFLKNLVNEDSKQLKEGIIQNRLTAIKMKNESVNGFEEKVFSQSAIEPSDAVQFGLIDQLLSFEGFKQKYFKRAWVSERNLKKYKNPLFNMIYEMKRMYTPDK